MLRENKQSNVFYISTSHNLCFCTNWQNRKPGNSFHVKAIFCFANKHKTQSRVRPDYPSCHSATWICMCGQCGSYTLQVSSKSVQGFWILGDEIWPFHYFGYLLLFSMYSKTDTDEPVRSIIKIN